MNGPISLRKFALNARAAALDFCTRNAFDGIQIILCVLNASGPSLIASGNAFGKKGRLVFLRQLFDGFRFGVRLTVEVLALGDTD